MAKLCMIRREKKRTYCRNKYWEQRVQLRSIINSQQTSLEDKEQALSAISRLPKDSSLVRRTRRCSITGRARGVYRKFGLCRNMIRIYAMIGAVPGLRKASW